MSLPDDSFIFVSYSSRDSDFVHAEIERLERQGFKVWYDKGELQPGRIWAEEICKAIKACACFIVFITQDSIISPNVLSEIDKALEIKKPFICIFWENVDLPPKYREPIKRIQALERYAIRRKFDYEEPLSRALSEFITLIPPDRRREAPVLPEPPVPQSDVLLKIFFFSLLMLMVIFVFLATGAFISPHLATYPGDPLGNRLSGFLAGSFFIVIALGLGVGALAVYRINVGRKKS